MSEMARKLKAGVRLEGASSLGSDAALESGFHIYAEMISYVERLHRLVLDLIKDEFARLDILDINSVQGLLLYNVGTSELSVGELRSRGYYQGSNVSYNLRKLVDMGYMNYERNTTDRRAVRVSLSEKGENILEAIRLLFLNLFQESISRQSCSLAEINAAKDTMLLTERLWLERIRYIY